MAGINSGAQRALEAQATKVSKRFCLYFFVPPAELAVFRTIPLRGSNPKPITYEAIALPIELRWLPAHDKQARSRSAIVSRKLVE